MTSRRSLAIFLGGLAILLLGVAAWLGQDLMTRQSVTSTSGGGSGTALIGGPFSLTDQNGATRTEADFAGRFMLVYFGYTYCPDICPTSLLAMSQALDSLDENAPELAAKIAPVFVTVDPERDTIEVMKAYSEHFHEDLVALTGSDEQVAEAAKAYRVYYRKAESESASDYLVDHSGFIYLMGPDGAYVGHYSHNVTAEALAEGLKEQLGS